jgi:hypothetical protein
MLERLKYQANREGKTVDVTNGVLFIEGSAVFFFNYWVGIYKTNMESKQTIFTVMSYNCRGLNPLKVSYVKNDIQMSVTHSTNG